MHANTWFPSNEMHESPNLTNGPLCRGGQSISDYGNSLKPKEICNNVLPLNGNGYCHEDGGCHGDGVEWVEDPGKEFGLDL